MEEIIEKFKFNRELIEENLSHVCCACLTQDVNVTQADDRAKVLFRDVFRLEIEMEGLETCICQNCLEKLVSAHQFYNQAQWSLQYLTEKKKKLLGTIIEDTDIDVEDSKDEIVIENDSSDDNTPLLKLLIDTKLVKGYNTRKKNAKTLNVVPIEEIEQEIEHFKKGRLGLLDFNCIVCEFKGVNRRHLAMHMSKHNFSEKKNNYCSSCNRQVSDINEHKLTHKNQWECKFCMKMFVAVQYVGHLKRHAEVILTCPVCHKKYLRQEAFHKHKLQHVGEQPFICPKCNKTFKTEHTLQEHVAIHNRYSCKECGKDFEIPELLFAHICSVDSNNAICSDTEDGENKKVTENIPKTEEGKDTSFKIEESTFQIEHYLKPEVQSQENSLKQKEPQEDILKPEKPQEDSLKQEKIELNKVNLTCEICQKNYKNIYTLQAHIKGHMNDYRFRCSHCNKGYTSKADLIIHENSKHSKTKSFICSTCGKGYSTKGSLTTHMKTHGGRNEVCEICQKKFCRKIDLKLHLQKHKGERPFLCPDCGMAFAQKSHLISHLTIHSDSRPFACHMCDKKFKKKELLKHHIRLHGEKSLKCLQCPYECHKSYRMQCHMKMHAGSSETKSNFCKLCDKGFSNGRLLQNHMECVHRLLATAFGI